VSFDVHVIYIKIKFDIEINKYWELYEIIREKIKGRGSWNIRTFPFRYTEMFLPLLYIFNHCVQNDNGWIARSYIV
jgi:hypothetical protein